MAKRKLYGNILDIPLKKINFSSNEKVLINAVLNHFNEIEAKEKELFMYYGLERPDVMPSAASKLIQKMAKDLHIIGFYEETELNKVGRPSKWKGWDGSLLLLRTEIYKIKYPDKSLNSIIDIIRKKYYSNANLKSLYARYQETFNSKESIIIDTKKIIKKIESQLSKEDLIKTFEKFEKFFEKIA